MCFLAIAIAGFRTALADFPDCEAGPLKDNLVCDSTAAPVDRAQALVELFTLDEMVQRLIPISYGVPRLGLPTYIWWNEALVCCLGISSHRTKF